MSSRAYRLECGWCGREYPSHALQRLCTDCKRPLVARYELNPDMGSQFRDALAGRTNSLWRYWEVLPLEQESMIVSLGEGCSPCIRSTRLATHLGLSHLWIKDESQNPTGSFKARGMTVAVSRAIELGAKQFSLPSAGNAAGAAAAYGALAGCPVRVYMPADSGDAFFAECCACGAEVFAVDGTIADCGKQMAAECDPEEWFDLSTLKEPYRLEGKKTMGYELFEDFDSSLPDVIVYPTGGGTGLIGMWKAFAEMEQMGWIGPERPRMISVQAEGCAPIIRAFESGAETAEPIANPQTAALGLRVPGAVGDFLILRAIRESQGSAIAVSESDWAKAQNQLARATGLFPSPEGGAVIAAIESAIAHGTISPQDKVVAFNTGSGFKYPPAVWPKPGAA
jgi:threonine synthase